MAKKWRSIGIDSNTAEKFKERKLAHQDKLGVKLTDGDFIIKLLNFWGG